MLLDLYLPDGHGLDLVRETMARKDHHRPDFLVITAARDMASIRAASRALELLDELLRDWDLIPVPTIGNLPIGAVEESELERRLRAALIAWGERTEGASVTSKARP